MLKDFISLYNVDLNGHIVKKPIFKKENGKFVPVPDKNKWLDYLEWATIVQLLYENGAESVRYFSLTDISGYPAFFDKKGENPFVRVQVGIDDKQFRIEFPVIDGNKPVAEANQLDIHKAQQRAFVKCVAINTGLGLKLWQKEEQVTAPVEEPKSHKTLKPFPANDAEKFNATVKWLADGKGNIDRIKQTYILDEETEFALITAAGI